MIQRFRGKYAFLSNFYPAVIQWGPHSYPTVEHAYQARKTLSKAERELIRQASTPGAAKRLGRRVTLRSDWDSIKILVMKTFLAVKFADAELARMLLETGDELLVEGNTWGDRFWGVDEQGVGENNLGRLLMELRQKLREQCLSITP